MVAAQVIKLLWAASLAVAAPQLDFGDQRSVQRVTTSSVSSNNINQDQVVSEVVGVLQPQIAKAVADALASLRTTSISSSTSSKASSSTGFAGGRSGNSKDDVKTRAEYNFEYKVADEAEQTYISQQEERDGDNLIGSYSYVDPNGALVTVNYEAGAMGFSATSEKKDGFISIKSRKNNKSKSSAGTVRTGTSSSSSSSVDQSALISQIIATLQPQINSAVQSALATSSTISSPRVSSASSRSISSSGSGSVEGTFGNGVSVSIDTPEYNIAY